MPKFADYEIWTAAEAKAKGYVPTNINGATPSSCLDFINQKRHKRTWLCLLTPERSAMLRKYLDLSSVCYSFILVDESTNHRDWYCVWGMATTRDN